MARGGWSWVYRRGKRYSSVREERRREQTSERERERERRKGKERQRRETVSLGKHIRFTRADGVNYLAGNGEAQNNYWHGKTAHQRLKERMRRKEKSKKKNDL